MSYTSVSALCCWKLFNLIQIQIPNKISVSPFFRFLKRWFWLWISLMSTYYLACFQLLTLGFFRNIPCRNSRIEDIHFQKLYPSPLPGIPSKLSLPPGVFLLFFHLLPGIFKIQNSLSSIERGGLFWKSSLKIRNDL